MTLQAEFQPPMDQGEFLLKMKSAPGSSIAETRGRLEEVLKALGEFPEVRYTYGSIASGDADTVRDAAVFVKLADKKDRTRTTTQVRHDARLRLQKIPGILLSVQEDPDAWQKPLQVAIKGDDIVTLKKYAAAVKKELYSVPGIVDIEAGMEDELPEYRLVVNRERAAASGLGSGAVAGMVATLVGGQAVTTYEDSEGEAVNVRVRLPQQLRGDIRQVADLKASVPTMTGTALVPLTDLVTFTRATSPAEINRRDMSRQLVVDANLDGLPLGTAGTLATEAASRVTMEPGYTLALGGDTEMMVESFGYMAEALLLAVIFVYLILAAQFESFIDPLSIMLSLPLSIVGMAGMLRITGDTINIMSLIGLIMLMGLVTKNAILLIDYTKVLRGRGLERREALITAGRTRLRPILMTTTAMIFGMLPLFFGLGEGAEFRAPMARAVVGGLITSTMLTLIVVPVVYTILDDITAWLFRKRAAAPAAAALVVAGDGRRCRRPGVRPGLGGRRSRRRWPGRRRRPRRRRPAPGVKVLTLEQALAIAAKQNRDVQSAIEYKNWVEGKYLEERSYALPQGSFTGTAAAHVRQQPEPAVRGPHGRRRLRRQRVVRDRLRRDLRRPAGHPDGRSSRSRRSCSRGARSGRPSGRPSSASSYSDQQLRRFRQAVVKDVTTAFWNVLAARELVRIAEEDVAQKTRHLDETTKRQQAGTATDYDVLAAQVAVDNAKPSVIRTQNLVRSARAQLRFLLAEPDDVDVEGTLGATVQPLPTYEAALALALKNRPELGRDRRAAGHLQRAHQDRRGRQQAARRRRGGVGHEVAVVHDALLVRALVERRRSSPRCRSSTAGGRRGASPRRRATSRPPASTS